MKVGIIGAGAVGTACAKAMLLRGTCSDLALLDINERRLKGVVNDLTHGAVLCSPTRILAAAYDDLADATVVVITAGINEMAGRAIDRGDALGRLRLLPTNAAIYRDVVPRVAAVAPRVPILVVTDPPDPLADVARGLTSTNPIVSAGTFLDTLRFRVQIGRRLGCHPASVEALVIGEHGTSQVYVWSSARVGSSPVLEWARQSGLDPDAFRSDVEQSVRFANIDIIEGTGASQHGIGIVTARIVEAMLRDEQLVAPVGVYHEQFGVTLSLPSVIDRTGVSRVIALPLSAEEGRALDASAKAIRDALAATPQNG
jgi:L-lactate dehydrogenase